MWLAPIALSFAFACGDEGGSSIYTSDAGVDEVWIARGKRVEKLPATAAKPDDLRGPTGNFRAPMLRRGRKLLVGFHAASVEELADSNATS